jgi:hypothetical protein
MKRESLHELLLRLEQPFDVDALRLLMDQVGRAASRERDGLVHRVPRAASDLDEATAEALRRAEEVAAIDDKTGGGLLGTLLSSVDHKGVEQRRADAARAVAGDLAVLERRIEDARAQAAQVSALVDVVEYGLGVLDGLKPRAEAAEVPASEVATIDRARAVVAALPARVLGLPAALDEPLVRAEAAAEQAGAVLGRLRSAGRASTLGEAFLDEMVGPDVGALGQKFRQKVAEAAPRWVPGTSQDPLTAEQAKAEVEAGRTEAQERARRDAEARAAAMAELDALEKEGW